MSPCPDTGMSCTNDTTVLSDFEICQGDSVLIFGIYQSSAGLYYDSLQNISGCDSFIFRELIVNPNHLINLSQAEICDGDSSLIFGQYRNVSGLYYDSITSIHGCDSVIVQELLVNPVYSDSLPQLDICQQDTVIIFGQPRSLEGLYIDSSLSVNGCDSITYQNLSVHEPYDTLIFDTICRSTYYIFPDGDSSNQSTLDTSYFQTTYGCDSIIVVYLQTEQPSCPENKIVYSTLTNAAEQVFDIDLQLSPYCDVSSIIFYMWDATKGAGYGQASGRFFNPGITRVRYVYEYSNLITGNCTFKIEVVEKPLGIFDAASEQSLSIYPNPNNGNFRISFNSELTEGHRLTLIDASGKMVFEKLNVREKEVDIMIDKVNPGIYLLKVENGNSILTRRILIK